MTFLNPWLLAGVGAIAAPILIHMMMRRRVRRMRWAAMRFLEVVLKRNEKKLRVEDRLLLLLRCLLLILLALALARPAFRSAGMSVGGGARTIVLALDNSESMGLTDGGASRIEYARKAAEEIVDGLPAGSSAALVLFSDVARPVVAEPATDLNLVRKLIGQSALTDRGSNVHPALSAALDILKRHAPRSGTVYLITDAQATGWRELPAMRREIAASGARVTIVVPGPAAQPNLGISDIQLGSAMAPAGTAARFTIQATNYGGGEARNVTVGLSIDGQPPSDQAVISLLQAGESRRVSLFGKFSSAGFHAVTAQLPPDHLTADDRRTMVLRAVDEVRILLVSGDAGATPGDTFFLERALAPVPPEDRDRYFVKIRTVSAADLATVKIADFDAVALVDLARLEKGTVAALEKYVGDGGGLMIFPGEKTDIAATNILLGGDNGLLPATMGAPWGNAAEQTKFRSLEPSGYTHPMVSIWQDPAAGTISSARFFKGVPLRPLPMQSTVAGEPVVVLRYSDGAPAIVERTWGAGRVIQFSSTADTAWNDLPVHPAFVPLMQRALGRLVSRQDEALNIPVGAAFTLPAQPDWLYKEMTVTPPGAASGAGIKSTVGLIHGEPILRYAGVDYAGTYALSIASTPPARFLFAAQPDPAESNLAPVPDAELKTLAPGTEVFHWTAGLDVRSTIARDSGGHELWTFFALLALAAACSETYLAGRFSAAK